MASSSKRQTTFAKLQREQAVRERRQRKELRKAARKEAAAAPDGPRPEGDDEPVEARA